MKVIFKPKAKELFLKYALPCSSNPEEIKRQIKKGKFSVEIEKDFPTATGALKVMEDGKRIDEDTVREYFWFKHAEVLEESTADEEKIFKCLVMPGKLLNEEEVKLVNGEKRKVDASLIDEPKKGSLVVVHYNYVAEKIQEEDKQKIKKELVKRNFI